LEHRLDFLTTDGKVQARARTASQTKAGHADNVAAHVHDGPTRDAGGHGRVGLQTRDALLVAPDHRDQAMCEGHGRVAQDVRQWIAQNQHGFPDMLIAGRLEIHRR
jgi:hypothetical protein